MLFAELILIAFFCHAEMINLHIPHRLESILCRGKVQRKGAAGIGSGAVCALRQEVVDDGLTCRRKTSSVGPNVPKHEIHGKHTKNQWVNGLIIVDLC